MRLRPWRVQGAEPRAERALGLPGALRACAEARGAAHELGARDSARAEPGVAREARVVPSLCVPTRKDGGAAADASAKPSLPLVASPCTCAAARSVEPTQRPAASSIPWCTVAGRIHCALNMVRKQFPYCSIISRFVDHCGTTLKPCSPHPARTGSALAKLPCRRCASRS